MELQKEEDLEQYTYQQYKPRRKREKRSCFSNVCNCGILSRVELNENDIDTNDRIINDL